jgi:hypothetical protein
MHSIWKLCRTHAKLEAYGWLLKHNSYCAYQGRKHIYHCLYIWNMTLRGHQYISRAKRMLHSTQKLISWSIRKRHGCMVEAYANNRKNISKYPKIRHLLISVPFLQPRGISHLHTVTCTRNDRVFGLSTSSCRPLDDPSCFDYCGWKF